MTWYGWLLLLLLPVMYGLGMLGARAFRKPYGPDRRVGDRRTGERRQGERRASDASATSHAIPGAHARSADRRQGERRRGERRRPRALWPTATVILSAALLSVIGVVTYAESRVGSIFVQTQPELTGAGWADCATPITWSVDTSRLSTAESATAIAALQKDFSRWQDKSGLRFEYVGQVPISYDDTNYTVSSAMHPSPRHIYVAFLRNSDSSLLDTRTVGFASPSKVLPSDKQITEGSIVLSIEYVEKVAGAKETALYLHEIGHALGLGHGTEKQDVMYYMVDRNNELSPADIAGIRSLTHVCEPTGATPGAAGATG